METLLRCEIERISSKASGNFRRREFVSTRIHALGICSDVAFSVANFSQRVFRRWGFVPTFHPHTVNLSQRCIQMWEKAPPPPHQGRQARASLLTASSVLVRRGAPKVGDPGLKCPRRARLERVQSGCWPKNMRNSGAL